MRGKTPKRELIPDHKYQRTDIGKFINYVMERGKKTVAQNIVYSSFDIIHKKTEKDPLEIFDKAIRNVSPEVEVRSRRIGGGNYQIPIPVMGNRKLALAYRWIIKAASSRKGMPMKQKLAVELMEAAEGTGTAVKKREDTYRMAEANRAFAHFGRPRKKKK